VPERRYTCRQCEGEFVAANKTGPLPQRCDECLPHRQRWNRRHRQGLPNPTIREQRDTLRAEAAIAAAEMRRLREDLRTARRAATMAERGRSHDARAALPTEEAIFDEVETRARMFGPPGIDTVKRCLIRLRHAEGAKGTADAAEDLARALIVWARVLRADSQGRVGEDSRLREAA
jgi:hypothetical protein